MSKIILVKFRATTQEYMRIRQNAATKGFSTVSGFLRSLTLGNEDNLWLEKKTQEIYKLVKGIQAELKRNR